MEKQYDKNKRKIKYERKTKKISFNLKKSSDGYIYERFLKLRDENIPIAPYVKLAIRKKIERNENVDISQYNKPITIANVENNIMHITITFNQQDKDTAEYIQNLDQKSNYITRAILEMIATGDLTAEELKNINEKANYRNKYNERPQITLFKGNKKDEEIKNILNFLYSKSIDDNEFMKDAIIEKWTREYKAQMLD